MADTLPIHLAYGRSNMPGPVTGGYTTITLGPFKTVAITTTDLIRAGLIMPFAMRLENVAWCTISPATANVSFSLNRNATAFVVAGSDEIMAADVAVDVDEAGNNAGSTLLTRDLARNDRVFVAVTADGTGALTDFLSITLTGIVTGVVNLSDQND